MARPRLGDSESVRLQMVITEDEVKAVCAAALSAYKVPKLVEFRDELPHTAVGKALRRLLVDEELAGKSEATSTE